LGVHCQCALENNTAAKAENWNSFSISLPSLPEKPALRGGFFYEGNNKVAFNGSGTFNRIYNWVTDKSNTVPVTASRMDAEMDGMATGLTTAICRDGQSTATARIPFAAGIGVSDGSAGTPAINFTGDANSGIYSIGADNIGVAAGGAKVLDIATTGLAVTGTFSSSGAATLSGAATFSSTAAVTGDFSVATNKFNVTATSGNTTVAGTLGVTGAATLSSTLAVTGTLVVNGTKMILDAATGNLNHDGDLHTFGAGTIDGALSAASVTGAMVAAQAGMETGTSTTTVVTPGRQQYHPSAAKVWVAVTFSGGTPSAAASYGISSITDTSAGKVTVNPSVAFSSVNYATVASPDTDTGGSSDLSVSVITKDTSSFVVELNTVSVSGANTTTSVSDFNFSVVAYGDQ
jgi:hypothetical protein